MRALKLLFLIVPCLFAATFSNGSPNVRQDITIPGNAPLYLRMKRQGSAWTQSYSYDGSTWTQAVSFSVSLQIAGVGVFSGNAGSGTSAPAHTALVDYFRVIN